MQVTRIECNVGFTLNVGDMQFIKAYLGMTAELDRHEDPDAAYAELRGKVLANCVAMGADAHPDRVRQLLGGQAALPAPTTLPGGVPGTTTAPEVTKTKAKTGPKPKTAEPAAPATQPANGVAADGMLGATTLGGLDQESTLDGGLGESNLLDDAPELTPEIVKLKCREVLQAKGDPGLLEVFKKAGVKNFSGVTSDKLATVYKLAEEALAS